MSRKDRRAGSGAPAMGGSPPARSADHLFDLAVAHHQSGRLAEAESLYRDSLTLDPNHADSLNCLGILAHQCGRNDAALELIGRAIAMQERNPQFHYNIALVLAASGRMDDAVVAQPARHRTQAGLHRRPHQPRERACVAGQVERGGSAFPPHAFAEPTVAAGLQQSRRRAAGAGQAGRGAGHSRSRPGRRGDRRPQGDICALHAGAASPVPKVDRLRDTGRARDRRGLGSAERSMPILRPR